MTQARVKIKATRVKGEVIAAYYAAFLSQMTLTVNVCEINVFLNMCVISLLLF